MIGSVRIGGKILYFADLANYLLAKVLVWFKLTRSQLGKVVQLVER